MKKQNTLKILISIFIILYWTTGCKHDPPAAPEPEACDTLHVTYPQTVYPILQDNCIGCHGGAAPSAGLDFTDYNAVAGIAENGSLLGAIRHQTGYSPMPQGAPRLSDCDISKIAKWIADTTFTIPPVGIPCDPDTAYFQNTVLPLLQSSCGVIGCHDAVTATEGVIMTDYQNIISTGQVRAFNPGNSEIYQKMTDPNPDEKMPPSGQTPLTQEQIDAVYKWISQGAKNNYCDDTECDTINVTFSGNIWPVVQNRCLGCHSGASPSGNIRLENHADLVVVVNNGKLMGAIRHEQGFSPMPKNGIKLTDCNITQFQKWIDNGTPNK